MICSILEKKDKLLTPKLDSLLKHAKCHKCNFMFNVDVGFYYMNKNFVHSKNEKQYTTNQRPMSWTYPNVIFPPNRNGSMSNLLVFITSLLTIVH
jgi:hypothetical protein